MKPRILSTARLSFPLATAIAALLAAQAAFATNLYWDVNGTTAGFSTVVGAWNDTNNFWNTSSTGGAGTVSNTPTSADDLFISQATTNTGSITISGATKNASSITFAANAGPTVTITGGIINIGGTGTSSGIFGASSGANTISSALQLNSGNTAFSFSNSGAGLLTIGAVTGTATTGNVTQTITVGSSSTGGITLNGIIADVSGSATKVALNVNNTSTGNTVLSGANTFTGGVTVTAGRLFANTSASALGAGTLTLNGGTLDFNGTAAINFGRNTTVGGNVTIISQKSAAGAGVTYTLGTLSIGSNTLAVTGGNVTSGTAGLIFGATTFTGSPTFTVTNPTGTTQLTLGAITGGSNGFTKSSGGVLVLSAANTYSGPTIVNQGTLSLGNVGSLGTTSAITLGSTTTATLSTSTTGITIAAPITLGNTGITSTVAFGLASAAVGNLTLNGAIGGSGNLTFTTPNVSSGGNLQTTVLGAASNYAGSTLLTNGNLNNTVTLKNGVINALPVTTVLTLNGGAGTGGAGRILTYDLNGNDQTLAGLTNTTSLASRNQRVTSSTAATLTVNNSADFTYGGTFTDVGNANLVTTSTITGAIALTKSGAGTLTLNGAVNSFTGNVNVTGGTLVAGVAGNNTNSSLGASNNTRTVTVSTGGTLRFDVGNVFNTNFSASSVPALNITGGTVTNAVASNNALGNVTLAGGTLSATNGHATYGGFDINGTITSTGTSTISSTGGIKMILTSSGANNVDTASTVDVQSGTLTVSAPLADLFTAEAKISGLSKIGAGVLALSNTNTYTGATSVTVGTLTLSGSGSINGSSGITLNGSGAKILQTSSVATSPALTLTQGTLTGSGTVDTVTVGAGTGGIISNNDGTSGAAFTIGNLTLAGAANLNLFSSTIAADLIVTGTLTTAATPATITANNLGGWTNGNTYTLLTYGGGLIAGSGNNFTQVVNNLSARQAPTWGDTGTAITLAIAGDSPYWFGNGDGKWNLASANNWKLISNNNDTVFLAGDDVLFDDNATGAGAISVDIDVADVATNNTIFNNITRDYTLSGGFGISAGTLTKSGAANVTIGTVNTYTGATNINAGTITLSGSGTLGSGSALTLGGGKLDLGTSSQTVGAVSVTAPAASGDTLLNGSLTGTSYAVSNTTGNVILSANLLGAGAFTKTGAGTLTLSGTNTYTGATTISAGILNANSTAALGNGSATNTLIFTGGTLQAGGNITSPATRTVTLTNTGLIDTNGNAVSIAGIMSGAGGVTKSGAGTLTLTGASNYSGATTIGAGTLNANTTSALGNGSATNTLIFTGGTLQAGGNITSPATRLVSLTSTGVIDTNGNSVSFAGVASGGGLTKNGAGTLTFSAFNTFTGPITINSGTLEFFATATGALYGSTQININGASTLKISAQTGNQDIYNGRNYSFDATGGGSILVGTGNYNAISTPFSITTLGGARDTIGLITTSGAFGMNLGATVATFDVTLGSDATSDLTINPIIANSGSILKTGTGRLTLTGANTYSGTTTIGAGTLIATATNRLGNSAATNTLIFTGGTLQAGGAITSVATRTVTLTSTGVIDTNNFAVSIAGIASGAGGLTKTGLGTLTLSGVNTYIGATTINDGTLSINTIANIGAASSAIGAPTTAPNGLIAMGNAATTGTLIYTGAVQSTDRTIQIGTNSTTPAVTDTGGATIEANGASNAALTFSSAIFNTQTDAATGVGANRTLTLQGSSTGTNTISGTIQDNLVSGAGTGTATVGVTKAGAGTWILSGTNTYTGQTIVTGGTTSELRISSATALDGTSSILVSSGRLALAGGITIGSGKTITINGSGNSAGALTNNSGDNEWAGNVTIGSIGTRIGNLGAAAGDLKISGVIDSGANVYGILFRTGIVGTSVTLSGANTYLGDTTLATNTPTGGSVILSGGANRLPTTTKLIMGLTTVSGVLDLNGQNQEVAGISIGQTSGALSNAVKSTAAATFTVNTAAASPSSYSGLITGGISLVKTGTDTLTLSGANTYTGGTTLNQGTLTVGTGGTLGATTGALAVNNSNSTDPGTNAILNLATAVDTTTGSLSGTIATPTSGTNTATINNGGSGRNFTVNQTAAGSYAGVIAGDGSFTLGSLSTNTLTLTGANTYTGGTTVSAGTLQLGAGSTTGTLSTSSAIVNNANLTINRSNAVAQGTDFSGAAITGTGSLTQAGTGTTTLNVANSYSGGTTVSAGTLALSNNSAAGTAGIAVSGTSAATLQIDAGITLAGNNITFSNTNAASSVKHDVAASGTYTTGTSGNLTSSFVGGQANTTAEILGGTSSVAATLEMLFKDTSAATNDAIRRSDVFGTAGTSTDTYVIQLSTGALASDSALAWLNGSNEWVHAGTSFFNETYNFAVRSVGDYGFSGGNVWAVVDHGGAFAAVPEPTSALAGLLIGAGLLRRRRSA